MSTWEHIDVITEEGAKKLSTGQVLVFNFEGSPNAYKIMRIAKGKVWGRRVDLYRPDQVKIVDRKA